MRNRYTNSILLSAIGDALGWITEFEKTQESIIKKYDKKEIDSFYDWKKYVGGRFNGYLDKINSGSYSDDTQLLLSVARSIKPNGEINNIYFSKTELPNWLSYARGAGRTIKNAARKIERNSATWNNNFFKFKAGKSTIDYRESGANGAAMRVLPIALANYNNFEKIKENIFANSIITHGHPRAIVGAILYGFAINVMLQQKVVSFNFETFLTEIGKDIEFKFKPDFLTKPQYKVWLNEWNKNQTEDFISIYNRTVNETLNSLRDVYRFLRDEKATNDALSYFGCFAPSTKGSGISTVIAGIYLACKYYSQPQKAITSAVNSIGSDTDSIAAFAGSLVGALYDNIIIPDKWKTVQDAKYLNSIASSLHEISLTKGEIDIKENSITDLKSINEIDSDIYSENEDIFFNPLGKGTVKKIDRQKTLASGKYNLIIDVVFEIGQSCKFSKILEIKKNNAEKYFE
jgi:ADP-ribosylglycohydrolase